MVVEYLWVSVAVGIAQIADCALYVRSGGRTSLTAWAFSAIEFVWGAASIYILLTAESGIPKWLPTVFISYLVLWTIYGAISAKRHTDLSNITLTPKEVLVGGGFGVFFSVASLMLAVNTNNTGG